MTYIITAIALLMSVVHGVSRAADETANQQNVSKDYIKPGGARTFAIEYIGKVSGIPPGTKKLRIWMPVPQNSSVQSIQDLAFSHPARVASEPKYGNKIAYWELERPEATIALTMRFVCERKEVAVDLGRVAHDGADDSARFTVFKRADKLVVVDDQIRKLSRQVVAGRESTIEKARAIYDYVLGKMTYDKSYPGWGMGSTRHACDVGKGNCTDFHALFNSLCRAEGIASGFEIGLYLPYDKGKQEPLGGYHCWAFFKVPGKTWVPVDCSEASRFPERKEFFFGGHTSNRVTLSTGRDITLEPKQAGEPLNYFVNPYAEADGNPVKAEKSWSFHDLN
jgi:transglutaminase-like putative cysteine protease